MAKKGGYHSEIEPAAVEDTLQKIQNDLNSKDVLVNGQITIDFRGLGISGRLSSNDRPALRNLIESVESGQTGSVYISEISRLTRDQSRIAPYTLLELFKKRSVRIRTPEFIKNPRIQHGWDYLADELDRGIGENKVFNGRLLRKRRQKAQRGEFVGEPVIPGFIVDIKDTEPSGRNIYGKYRPYPPHAEIDEKILIELRKQDFREMPTHHALKGLMYPLFPPELKYMERLSALRKADEVAGVGYRITPSMIVSLATNPKLIGLWTWGDIVIPDNHEAAVPVNLWLEVFQGYRDTVKPRGRSINHEPLELDGLLLCGNHDVPQRISSHRVKGFYRCESDYVQGRGPSCLHITDHYLDKPLTTKILRKLDFTPFAEEVLMQMESDGAKSNLEEDRQKKEIAHLERRIVNLEEQLGWEWGVHDHRIIKQIEKRQTKLEELMSQPVPTQTLPVASYQAVKDFLTGLPSKWPTYPRALRNRLLKGLIDHVDIRHHGQTIEATICWKTGLVEKVSIPRARAAGNRESYWTKEELAILKKLWAAGSHEQLMIALPHRTWKAIAHQAYNLGLKRAHTVSERSQRRRWQSEEDLKGMRLYREGVPIPDIASKLRRTCSAVLQRAWEKGWRRLNPARESGLTDACNTNQNPMVSKRITSGLIWGGAGQLNPPN
ncbi:recombinase family protein [Chloroflexota bacterium]